jgi:hypothetical protein
MYGMVNKAVQELVTARYGEETWEKIKARSGVDVDVFISNEAYDDSITYKLVGAASEVLGVDAEVVLEAFGEHWVLETAQKGYGHLMTAGGKTFVEFLENLPAFHTRVALIFPKLQPPTFVVTNRQANSLRLHHHTNRPGLAPFTKGLLKGLAKRFGTTITIEHSVRRGEGSDHDAFDVSWPG